MFVKSPSAKKFNTVKEYGNYLAVKTGPLTEDELYDLSLICAEDLRQGRAYLHSKTCETNQWACPEDHL